MRRAPLSLCLIPVLFTALVTSLPRAAIAQELVADLSSHHVAITTGFTGQEVLLFGAVEGTGDVVVIITGPREEITVRRKARLGPIWVNATSQEFEGVPNFYAISATRPLEEFTPLDMRKRLGIGVDHLKFKSKKRFGTPPTAEEMEQFRRALVRGKQAEGLYSEEIGAVSVLAGKLFRTKVNFPANMAIGQYTATVYLVKDGTPSAAVTTPLLVEKIGLGADVFDFAHQQSALYGIIAILIAVAAGWLAAAIFRKV
jgi:uncharacterized protein (TIGR02186 family)